MNVAPGKNAVSTIPFDQARVDRLMEEAGIDVLVATSKHNVQYLLGGYKFIFFAAMDAIGHSRYLPVVIYEKGRPDHAAYVANRMEGGEHQNNPFWTPTLHAACWGTLDAAKLAVEHLEKIGKADARIGIEPAFLPADAYDADPQGAAGCQAGRCDRMLERMRAIKTPSGAREAAHRLGTDHRLHAGDLAWAREGTTKAEIVEQLRREETNRGLQFEYCLLTLGSSHNRAVSPQAWKKGEVMSIDSGGNYHGYIGDLCRMGVFGEPDAELEDLLAEDRERCSRRPSPRCSAGTLGGDMISHAEGVLKARRSRPIRISSPTAWG